jgi:hypothetical protein
MLRPRFALPVLSPIIRRVAWHIRRIGGQLDRRFFLTLAEGTPAPLQIGDARAAPRTAAAVPSA